MSELEKESWCANNKNKNKQYALIDRGGGGGI